MAKPKEEKAITELIASLIYNFAGTMYPTVCKLWSLYEIIHICTAVVDESGNVIIAVNFSI